MPSTPHFMRLCGNGRAIRFLFLVRSQPFFNIFMTDLHREYLTCIALLVPVMCFQVTHFLKISIDFFNFYFNALIESCWILRNDSLLHLGVSFFATLARFGIITWVSEAKSNDRILSRVNKNNSSSTLCLDFQSS